MAQATGGDQDQAFKDGVRDLRPKGKKLMDLFGAILGLICDASESEYVGM